MIGDVVLVKKNNVSRMNWKKENIVNVIRGRDNMVTGVELCIFQPKLIRTMTINRLLQLIVPLTNLKMLLESLVREEMLV